MLNLCKIKVLPSDSSSEASATTAVLEIFDEDHHDEDANHGAGCTLRVLDDTGAYQGTIANQSAAQLMEYFGASRQQVPIDGKSKKAAAAKNDKTAAAQTKIQMSSDDNAMEVRAWTIDENGMVKNYFAPIKLHRISSDASEHLQLLLRSMNEAAEQWQVVATMEQARDAWKTTAEELEGGWEREKSKLFRNFLILYNGRKDEFQRAIEKEKRLESELEVARDKIKRLEDDVAHAGHQGRKRNPAHDYSDVPVDDEVMSTDEVMRLAKGPEKKQKKTATTATSKKRGNASQPKAKPQPAKKRPPPQHSSDDESLSGHRRNPVTGALEIDGDDLLDDDFQADIVRSRELGDGENKKPPPKQKSGEKIAEDAKASTKTAHNPKLNDDAGTSDEEGDFWSNLFVKKESD